MVHAQRAHGLRLQRLHRRHLSAAGTARRRRGSRAGDPGLAARPPDRLPDPAPRRRRAQGRGQRRHHREHAGLRAPAQLGAPGSPDGTDVRPGLELGLSRCHRHRPPEAREHGHRRGRRGVERQRGLRRHQLLQPDLHQVRPPASGRAAGPPARPRRRGRALQRPRLGQLPARLLPDPHRGRQALWQADLRAGERHRRRRGQRRRAAEVPAPARARGLARARARRGRRALLHPLVAVRQLRVGGRLQRPLRAGGGRLRERLPAHPAAVREAVRRHRACQRSARQPALAAGTAETSSGRPCVATYRQRPRRPAIAARCGPVLAARAGRSDSFKRSQVVRRRRCPRSPGPVAPAHARPRTTSPSGWPSRW
jgi:hypothetical protein